jgi:putative ABC transport system permease protein
MGASLKSLLLLLSKNFLLLVLIAGGISLPIIQLVVDRWMENYPYRVEISWWTFLMPIAFILVITALTIGAQIIKAAYVNPSKLLKYE